MEIREIPCYERQVKFEGNRGRHEVEGAGPDLFAPEFEVVADGSTTFRNRDGERHDRDVKQKLIEFACRLNWIAACKNPLSHFHSGVLGVEQSLGPVRFATAWPEGQTLPLAAVIAEALALADELAANGSDA